MNRKDELLLEIAKLTLAELNGCNTHISEDIDPNELLILSLGKDRMKEIIEVVYNERLRLKDTWNEYKSGFTIDIDTLEICGHFDGYLDHSIRHTAEESMAAMDNSRKYYSNKFDYYTIKNLLKYDNMDDFGMLEKWEKSKFI